MSTHRINHPEIAHELNCAWEKHAFHSSRPTIILCTWEQDIRRLQGQLEVLGCSSIEISANAYASCEDVYRNKRYKTGEWQERYITPIVNEIVKVKGGWKANVNGMPNWFMNRYGVVTRTSTKETLCEILNSEHSIPRWRSLIIANNHVQNAFRNAVTVAGYSSKYVRGERVFAQRLPKIA